MSPALAYSTNAGALVMFGGQGGADTWAFDVKSKRWTQMTSSPGAATPPGLSQLASSMVYDGDDDVFVLFGGCLCTLDFGASSGDTWTYRLSSNTWTKVTPAVSPPARQGHHLVYDSANKRVILFGGFDATSGTYFNDVWIYSVTANTWSMVLPAVSPPARRMAAMVYDPVQQRTVLFGGQGPDALADVWVLQLQQSASGSSTPTLTSLSPSPVTAGSPGFTLTVTGANFASTSVVQWNGSNRTTTFVRAPSSRPGIAAADIASAGSALVSVSTPGSGGGTSNSLTLAIAAPTPAPILSSISPTTASAGGAAFTLTATGSNFTSGSIVQVNGASRYDNIRLVDAAHGGPSGQRCRRGGDSEHHRIHSGSGRRHVRSALADRRERESHADHHQSESGQRDGGQCRLHAHGHWHRLRRRRDRHGGPARPGP